MKYLNVLRSTNTDLHVAPEKRIDDYWNVDENRSLSDTWAGFTKRDTSKRICVVREETDKKSDNYSTDHVWPEAWSRIGNAAQKRETQEWAIEKAKLENAMNLKGIYSIDPDGEEHKDIMKNARRKLETPMAAAMPCKRKARSTAHG